MNFLFLLFFPSVFVSCILKIFYLCLYIINLCIFMINCLITRKVPLLFLVMLFGWLVINFFWTITDSHVSSVQSLSHVRFCDLMDCSTWGFPVHHQLLELTQLMSIELVMPSNRLIICGPLLFQPSIFPSIRVFSNESVLCIRCPKYWSFNFSISPSNEYSGLISFRMDWLDLLVVLKTLKSLLQCHSSKVSILQCSAFFNPTLISIHDYWKKKLSFDQTDLCQQSNVSAFSMLSRLVIVFLPRTKHLLISWLQ